MTAWLVVLLLGAGDCEYEKSTWEKAGLAAPCEVLVGAEDARLASAQRRWGLAREQAQCVLDLPRAEPRRPRSAEDFRQREDAEHLVWRRCLERWPTNVTLWRATVLTATRPLGPLVERLPVPPDGGPALADALLELNEATALELAQGLVRQAPGRLTGFFRDERLAPELRFELALTTLDRGAALTATEWEALASPLLWFPLYQGAWRFAAEQWLRLPETLRARVAGSVAALPLGDEWTGDLRPRLALGLLALGKPDEARRLQFAPLVPESRWSEELAMLHDAVRWRLTGARTLTPWDAAIAARNADLDDWEAWATVLPFVHPREALCARPLTQLGKTVRYTLLTPAVRARLEASSEASRVAVRAVLPVADAGVDVVVPATLLPEVPSPFVARSTEWTGAAPSPARAEGLPADFLVVRTERAGQRTAVLALSKRLDPVGEAWPGSYWLLLSKDGGGWDALYLGLAYRRPFEALALAEVPLLEGDVVRLVARDAPPGKRPLVVLEAPLAALRKDTDGDGLSDLVEGRLLLDPRRADTDRDGRADGVDATPRLDDRLAPTVRTQMLKAFFADHLAEAGDDDVRFVVGGAELGGLRAPLGRLITLTPAELEAAKARFGDFFPLRVELELDGPDRAYLEWSEGWRGGALRIDRRRDGRLVVTPLRSWIS